MSDLMRCRARASRLVVRCVAYACLSALFSCAGPRTGTERITPGDPELFASYVQPYLEARCASLDCHGASGRPLRLYSELGLRRDASLRNAPISEGRDPTAITRDELDDNVLAFAAVATASNEAATHLALLKPLAVAAGGIHHQGGEHWPTREALGYRCLYGFVVADGSEDVPTICAQALAAEAR